MGLFINLHKKVQEVLTRTAGEKHDDVQISKDIEKYAAEMGIPKEDLVHAIKSSIWTVSPSSGETEGVPNSNTDIISQLDAVRQQRTTMFVPAAFGDLTNSSSAQNVNSPDGTAPNKSPKVRAVEESSKKANADAQGNVKRAQGEENGAKRELENTRRNTDNNNANANNNVNAAQRNADKSAVDGNDKIMGSKNKEDNDNKVANAKYLGAMAAVETAKKNSEQGISEAQSKSEENNKAAEDEFNNATNKKNELDKTVGNLETEVSDTNKTVSRLRTVLDNEDATDEDREEYNKAVEKQKKLETELEKAKEEAEQAKKAVTEAEEKVQRVKQEGEELVTKATEEGEAKIQEAQKTAESAEAEMNRTKEQGQTNVAKATESANQENERAKKSVTAAQTEAQRVSIEGELKVSEANKTLKDVSRKVEVEKKKAAKIKAAGNDAVKDAEGEDPNSTAKSTGDFAQSLTRNGVYNPQVTAKLNQSNTNSLEDYNESRIFVAKMEAASSSAHRPLGNTPKVDIRHTAENLAKKQSNNDESKQGNNDELADESTNPDYPKKNPIDFGI